MKDCTRGVVRTPPKSEMTARMRPFRSAIAAHHLVVPESLASLDRPAEEGDVGLDPRLADFRGADQRPASAQRLTVLIVGPQLQRRPPLYAVRPVLGREQGLTDLDRGAIGVAENRRHLLVAVSTGARGTCGAQRPQAPLG